MILLNTAGSSAVSASPPTQPRGATPKSALAGLAPSFHRNRVARKANDAAWEYSYAVSALPGWHPLVEKSYSAMRKWQHRANRLGV